MIAKLIYLTSPGPDRYVLNVQKFGSEDIEQIEISEGHLGNIIADGAHYAFRKQYRSVPATTTEDAHERAAGAQ